MSESHIHLRVPAELKGSWVRESRAAGVRLTEWIVGAVERQASRQQVVELAPKSRPPSASTAVAEWQARLGLTDRAAAAALGMTLSGYQRQKLGRDQHGHPREASRTLLLACAAVAANLQPIELSSES